MSFYKIKTDAVPKGWFATPLADLVVAKAGNSKLIKGKMYHEPAKHLFQGYSASGADVWSDSYEYDADGVVVSAVGARCGKSFLAKEKWVAVANTHVVLPFEDAIDPKFLWYGINDEDFWVKSGTAQPFVVVSKSFERLFAIPPRTEQTRIVAKLEELLSDLDAGVAELKAAQKKLGQYRQSLLKAAVEGALTAEWRAAQKVGAGDTAPETGAQLLARILTERRARWEAKQLAKFAAQGKPPPKDWQNKYPEPVQPDTTDLPALPEGWVWASLDQLAEFITSGSRGWADFYSDAGATFIRSQNINKDWLDLSDIAFVNPPKNSEGARTRVQLHDLLLTITGANVGKAAHVNAELEDAYVSQHVALIRPVEKMLANFLHLFLIASAGGRGILDKEAYGAGKPGLNLQQVGAVVVPLSDNNEMQTLMDIVAAYLKAVSEQEQAITHALKQSTAQRQNILRAAFAGQLVPQDPNDEPASVLLERIRKERAAQATPGKRTRRRQVEIA